MVVIVSKCPARVGFLGNPSDGFAGKTVSFTLDNFHAAVELEEIDGPGIEILPNPTLDLTSFSCLHALSNYTSVNGYYGGIRLIQATIKSFRDLCVSANIESIRLKRGFRISYTSTIPRMVGLSGSSAIVVATFAALLEYYKISLSELHILRADLPEFILNVEKKELGIAAGLQDRVIQVYGGVVFMDFSNNDPDKASDRTAVDISCSENDESLPFEYNSSRSCKYLPIDPHTLPNLYIAYNLAAAGDSGKVHSTVKERWRTRDPQLVQGMKDLGNIAKRGADILLGDSDMKSKAAVLSKLMNNNFSIRRRLYGDDVVGSNNISMVELAESHGLHSKFTGSGGAIVCMTSSGVWFTDNVELNIVKDFRSKGFQLERIRIAAPNSRFE